jgi:AhpD family alkylhydroperoxidase
MMKPDLNAILDEIRAKRGGVARVFSTFDQVPAGVAAHFGLYEAVVLSPLSALTRADIEVLAVAVCTANECAYGVAHHAEPLAKYSRQFPVAKERQELLEAFARALTVRPRNADGWQVRFAAAGLGAAEYQHAALVVGYFNFANRLVFSQSLELEPDFAASCR